MPATNRIKLRQFSRNLLIVIKLWHWRLSTNKSLKMSFIVKFIQLYSSAETVKKATVLYTSNLLLSRKNQIFCWVLNTYNQLFFVTVLSVLFVKIKAETILTMFSISSLMMKCHQVQGIFICLSLSSWKLLFLNLIFLNVSDPVQPALL